MEAYNIFTPFRVRGEHKCWRRATSRVILYKRDFVSHVVLLRLTLERPIWRTTHDDDNAWKEKKRTSDCCGMREWNAYKRPISTASKFNNACTICYTHLVVHEMLINEVTRRLSFRCVWSISRFCIITRAVRKHSRLESSARAVCLSWPTEMSGLLPIRTTRCCHVTCDEMNPVKTTRYCCRHCGLLLLLLLLFFFLHNDYR